MLLPKQIHRRFISSRRRSERRLSPFVFYAATCVFALAIGCGRNQAPANQDPPRIPVKTAIIAPVAVPESSEYLGTLKSRHSTVLNPQVEGQITSIFVKSGDHVKAGTALMQIDPLKQQATVGSQDAARAAQEANVHGIVYLNRDPLAKVRLLTLPTGTATVRSRQELFSAGEIREKHESALEILSGVPTYALHYYDLHDAMQKLHLLT